MAFRGGNNNRNRNFGGGNYGGGPMGGNRMGGNMNMSPWDNQNVGNFGGGNMRQGGGGGVGGGQGMNAQALNLANNLLNNLFRNQNPPSLLDLPRGGGGGAGMGNRNQRGGPMVNRAGPGNRINNRRVQGGFQNRGAAGGAKPAPKQGAGGIRKQNAFDRAKKLLAKNATNKKKDSASGEKKNESKESPYASVPNDMFYCHLCKKHMWDANSFENHIKGRTHLMMREGIEESYRLKANMIRQEAKIAEQLKSIELDRLKRMGKSKQRQLEYCTMCDLNFHGHLSAHRKSDGHLQLKKFLHPKCIECNKEFATRIDFDSHLLSADHLKKAAEKNTKVGERVRNTLTILTEEDELKDVRPPQKKRKKVVKKADGAADGEKKEGEEGAEGEEAEGDDDVKKEAGEEGADETKEGDELNETQEEEEVALPVDPEDCIVDYAEGDDIPTEVDTRLPKYNWTRAVGAGLISKLECYECSLCGKFLDTEATAEVHARTVSHHRNFLKFINEKSSDTKIAQKRAAAALEESERKKRKIEEAEAAAAGAEAGDAEVKAENGDNAEEAAEGNEELYDPSEATGDDEDVEMAENGEGAEEEAAEEEVEGAEENGAEEMEAQEEDEEADQENEAEPEPVPVKVETKPEPVKTPAKVAPATPATPAPAAEVSPAKKATPARGSTAKATPRGRGRGRYNRY